jgi:hypothetical protein
MSCRFLLNVSSTISSLTGGVLESRIVVDETVPPTVRQFIMVTTVPMIDLDKMEVSLGTQTGKIIRFDTWWAIPTLGMATTLDQAKQVTSENGLPTNVVKPFTVAICDNGLYEVML